MKLEDTQKQFSVNMFTAIHVVRAVVPHMPRGGRIVNVSSITGNEPGRINSIGASSVSSGVPGAQNGIGIPVMTFTQLWAPQGLPR